MKKLMAVLIGCILTVSLFSACSWNPLNKDSGPETGPVGEWDMPIPGINPLGSQKLYADTEHMVEEYNITFIEDEKETTRSFYGEVWRLKVADNSEDPLKYLKKYAKKIGAKLYTCTSSDKLVFSLQNDREKDVIWWGDAQQNDEGYELSVIKEAHALSYKPDALRLGKLFKEVEDLLSAVLGSKCIFAAQQQGQFSSIPSNNLEDASFK